MNQQRKTSPLPNRYAALRFLCGCFGIGEKELGETLERVRENTQEPNKHFPGKLTRMLLSRSADESSRWHNSLVTVHHEALYQRICRENAERGFSFTTKITDDLIVSLLSLYDRLRPKLHLAGLSTPEAMWVLMREVFVPTVFIKLVEESRFGLGTEFQGEQCWYLPIKSGGRLFKPVARVLDCWLRVAGFRTAYGLAQSLTRGRSAKSIMDIKADNLWQRRKKSVERWLRNEPVQFVQTLHQLGREFAGKVAWLDQTDNWQARFTLAFAMQNICNAMDEFFSPVTKDSSLYLSEMLNSLVEERLACDGDKVFARPHSFFAARLLQLRLQAEGKWEALITPPQVIVKRTFPSNELDTEISSFRSQTEWRMNPGNHLLDFVKSQAVSTGRVKPEAGSVEAQIGLESYIFDLGVSELNRIFLSKRKGAGES